MSSREPFTYQALDVWIAAALQDLTREAEPSPRVWERIRRRAGARLAGRGHSPWLAPLERFFISASSGLVWEQFVRIGPADDHRRQLRSAFI